MPRTPNRMQLNASITADRHHQRAETILRVLLLAVALVLILRAAAQYVQP